MSNRFVSLSHSRDLLKWQHTLASSFSLSGVGLHTGCPVTICCRPAPPGAGIVFRRYNLSFPIIIKVSPLHVSHTFLSSNISANGVMVQCVEHLLSACLGLGVDNLLIDTNSAEIPILDGSALDFVREIQRVGIKKQSSRRRYLKVLKPLVVQSKNGVIECSPRSTLRCCLTFVTNHPLGGEQNYTYEGGVEQYMLDIAPARTFVFLRDAIRFWAEGFVQGGSIKNAVIFRDQDVCNPEGLRFSDEMVRHKILDFLGDLYQIGAPILGDIKGVGSGHQLNNQLVRALIANPDCWSWVYQD